MFLYFVIISCRWSWINFIQNPCFLLSYFAPLLLWGRGAAVCSNNAAHSDERNGRIYVHAVAPRRVWREVTKKTVTGMLVLQQDTFELNGARGGGTALRELPLGHLSPASITDTSKVALRLWYWASFHQIHTAGMLWPSIHGTKFWTFWTRSANSLCHFGKIPRIFSVLKYIKPLLLLAIRY